MRSVQLSFFAGNGSIRGWANEINGIWTPICLISLSVTTFLLPILITPAVCWAPAEMPESQALYINRKCWDSRNVLTEAMTMEEIPRFETKVNYINPHKRLPIVLFIQALFFLLPYVIWRSLESCSGINVNKMMGLAEGYSRLSAQERRNVSGQLASYLNQWLKSDPLYGCPWGTLTVVTVLTKTLFFVNSCTQFALYDIFLKGKNETNFGHELLRNLWTGNGIRLTQSSTFQRTTLCDVTIRKLTNLHRYIVQCHVQMNAYYEMICIYVWLWLCFVQMITVASSVYYGLNIIIPIFRARFVKRHLLASLNLPIQPTDNDIGTFTGSTLGQDGVTVLRWIGRVSSDLLVVDIVEHLWLMHHGRYLPVVQVRTEPNRVVEPACPTHNYPESQEPQADHRPYTDIPGHRPYADISTTHEAIPLMQRTS